MTLQRREPRTDNCIGGGAAVIWWTDVSGDIRRCPPDPERVVERIFDAAGGVLLMHSYHKCETRLIYVLELTEKLLRGAQERGIRICPLSEILEAT